MILNFEVKRCEHERKHEKKVDVAHMSREETNNCKNDSKQLEITLRCLGRERVNLEVKLGQGGA